MGSIHKELSYDQEGIESVKGIQFSVLGPEEIKTRSVVEITKPDAYSGNEPVIGGLFDPRMGIIDHNRLCSTCEQKNTFCPGHFGHISLARPIFHPLFFNTVRIVLKCVCFRCSRLMVSEKSDKPDLVDEIKRIKAIKNPKKRLDAMIKLSSNTKLKRCGDDLINEDGSDVGCRAQQPTRYTKEQIMRIVAEWKDPKNATVQKEFSAEDILKIFQRITDEDANLLGFNPKWNRPEYMIMTMMAVPPPCVRPSIIEENGQRREDDLTHKLIDIIKFNNQLKLRIESGKSTEEQLKDLTNLVQYHIATFMDNQIPGLAVAQQRNGRKIKSITDRLKKKEGRIRGNLNGKRVDQSARSVITPDPNIELNQLGVPVKIAMTLTYPERVNEYNITYLQELVRRGPDTWPGAKYVRIANENITVTLKYADKDKIANELRIGDIVDRHLADEDIVLFNRQPSLHKMSMMGFRVKVMQFQTFRLNPTVCSPFNADFDGDEMNLFLPQNPMTMSELKDLAAVPYLVLHPRDAKPIVEIIQDTMVGVFRLTKKWTHINDKVMANLQMVNSYFDGKLPDPQSDRPLMFSGTQAFSQILPEGLMIDLKNKADEKLRIVDGKLLSGTVDKVVLHSMSKGILPVMFHDYGPYETRRVLDNIQRLICRWLLTAGFSVGISDLVTDLETTEKLKQTISMYKETAYKKVQECRIGRMENKSIFNNEDFFERDILNVLNELTNQVGKIGLKQIDERTNRMINMVKSGSKGKETNVAQMIACVGQQNVDGKRVAYGFTDRTLPHYTKFDDGPEARGFVENSFISGLSPQEVFFHAMGGREGLIDTAVKSVTGDTPLLIKQNGKVKWVTIGEWIDQQLDVSSEQIKHYPEDRNLELLDLKKDSTYIPTGDEDGNVFWSEMTAITRHDRGNKLYEVTTYSGRSIKVPESKSLLVWDRTTNKFISKETPLIREGECLPLVAKLSPPHIEDVIDMNEYFPKSEYIYGSEFYKAVSKMQEAMKGRQQIPRGWWEKSNGIEFTLPYPDKAKLQRAVSGRCDLSNLKEGFIYPYHATRQHSIIPESFPLDYDNGVFIGLFLADGHYDAHSGTITITKEDLNVIEFTKKWFDRYQIKYKVRKDKKELGITTTTNGYCTLMGEFLTKLVGTGSRNKLLPDIAFVAPETFVKGVITGYFSGDGSVDKYGCISASSASQQLIQGLSLLLNRIGVFTRITKHQKLTSNVTDNIAMMHTMTIKNIWAGRFINNITLLIKSKQERLAKSVKTGYIVTFDEQNDVVLDPITEIKEISNEFPKLYDVTVPSTINFMAGTGHVFLDTSETGYIQRRLVKAMEDAKVYYDQTVRNATGSIVQYIYGEDGIDGTKIEKQYIPYITLSHFEIREKYHLEPDDNFEIFMTAAAIKQMERGWISKATEHFKAIVADREFLIKNVFKGENKASIEYAIPFERIIKNAMERIKSKGLTALQTNLTPGYILDTIDNLIENLHTGKPQQGIRFLHILLRLHLSPKPLITETHMPKEIFDWVVNEIKRYFLDSIVHAGEMVGIVAAQSMGEMSTQSSVIGSTSVLILDEETNTIYHGTVGKFIDNLIDNNTPNVVEIGNNSLVLNTKTSYKIIGISKDEKVSWMSISQVSRHPANGGLVKVTTRTGRSVTATLSHSFLMRGIDGIIEVKGSDLKLGDRIPVAKYIPSCSNTQQYYDKLQLGKREFTMDKEFGWFLGAYLADGSFGNGTVVISKNNKCFENKMKTFGQRYNITVSIKQTTKKVLNAKCGFNPNKEYTSQSMILSCQPLQKWIEAHFLRGSYNKRVPSFVYNQNLDFISGVISGYFDGDGNVHENRQMIRASSVNKNLINDISILLSYFNIFTKMSVEKNNLYTLHVCKQHAHLYQKYIGFSIDYKAESLDAIVKYNDISKIPLNYIDVIPETGYLVSDIAKALKIKNHSRLYGHYKRKQMKGIGRETLKKYINVFEGVSLGCDNPDIKNKINLLKQGVNADAVYDEIVSLEYLPDPDEYVYDFTVPGNESFMVNEGILVHNTLDSFHSSGTAAAVKATSGVPRLKELLSVSKNIKTPSLIIYLKPDIGTCIATSGDAKIQETKESSMEILKQLEIAKLSDILDKTEIYWDPPSSSGLDTSIGDDTGMLEVYRLFNSLQKMKSYSSFPWVLRMKLNKEKIYNLGLTTLDIYTKILAYYNQNVDCMFSDDNSNEIIFRIRLTKEALKEIDPDDALAALKAMEYNIIHNILLKGVKGIKKVSMRSVSKSMYNEETDSFNNITEWVLDTDGTNLQSILANPNIDSYRTRSNDIYEIYNVLGIEAARNALFAEFTEVIGEGAINYRHMSLLLDTMTNKGSLMSIDRHGINRGDVGPLAKCSFEETTDMLINASIFSEQDRINGVSANIMLGQLPPCGTGDHDIILDEKEFLKLLGNSKQPVEENFEMKPKQSCTIETISVKYKPPTNTYKNKVKLPKQEVTFI